MTIQTLRGTVDILPEATANWQWIENIAQEVYKCFNFSEIRTPVFESTSLFQRSIGEGTDIVSKEMYTFADRKNRSITLRPEGTASVVRSCLQHKLIQPQSIRRLFYTGPMFRYERPQAGRQRQFHQTGVELVGSPQPAADIEVISLLKTFFDRLGLKDVKFRVNSTGSASSKAAIAEKLRSIVSPSKDKLCADCQKRYDTNVLRIYDCKVTNCREIIRTLPGISTFLGDEDKQHFQDVLDGLDALGIEYVVDDFLVRGLDYYTKTIFEAYKENSLGACDALAGGGRYDGLFSEMGSSFEVPSVGFAVGMERIYNILKSEDLFPEEKGIDCYIINAGVSFINILPVLQRLRNSGISASCDLSGRAVKAQFKEAARQKADFAVIIGEEELKNDLLKIKCLADRSEAELPISKVNDYLKESLNKE